MEEKEFSAGRKRGYLNKDFELFHLKDKKNLQFELHYHDFNKIIVFISGKATYLIEGKAYRLKPWDVLLVNSNEVHKPLIDPEETYERIVIWVNGSFLEKHSSTECDLLTCFSLASSQKFNLVRSDPESLQNMKILLSQLEGACCSKDFGSEILQNALFIQFIVHLNRLFLRFESKTELVDIQYDEDVAAVLDYINKNLKEDLTIDRLSSVFFTNRYYLMHKFKMHTGYSIHNYILQKRLIAANHLIRKGKSATEACMESGFNDYSNFLRSFKKMFGLSPKKYHQAVAQLAALYGNKNHT